MSTFLKENKESTAVNLTNGFQIIGKACISILIIYYMFFNEKYGHNTAIVYGSFLVLAACVIIDVLADGELDLHGYHIGIWINFLIGIYALVTGIFVAYDQSRMLANTRLVLQYSFIVFAMYYYARVSRHGIKWILATINIAALLCCYFLLTHPYQILNRRYSLSPTDNPNALGVILACGIFSITFRIKPNSKKLFIDMIQMGIMFYCVIMTGSRKSFIASGIIMVFSIFELMRETKRTMSGWRRFLIIVIILGITVLGTRYIYRFYQQSALSSRMDIMLDDTSNGNRIAHYIDAFKIFLDKPLFGGGLEQFVYWSGTGAYAHSTYAEAIADFGLIGCLLYFYPIVLTGHGAILNAMSETESYKMRLILILYITEMFVGTVQIFFLDFVHYIIWFILFFFTKEVNRKQESSPSKYIL